MRIKKLFRTPEKKGTFWFLIKSRMSPFARAFLALHQGQDGVLSILSVFAALLLTMLLGMVMNVGRQVDGKLRLQNAADAAAYSGAVVQARGMNALAFTNHLLCEVFALTAILREGRDRNAESFVPRILAAWSTQPPEFARSKFPKFVDLGKALQKKLPQEQQLVATYSQWMAALSALQLPIFEQVLRQQSIPNYQEAVRQAFPALAQAAAEEVARRGGTPDFGRGALRGALWQPGSGDSASPGIALPVADPREDLAYREAAQSQRTTWANHYLNQWTNLQMEFFDHYGKLGQFGRLWRGFTCGQLHKLLAEYPDSNLPVQVLDVPGDPNQRQAYLSRNFAVVGVVSWHKVPELRPSCWRIRSAAMPWPMPKRRFLYRSRTSYSFTATAATTPARRMIGWARAACPAIFPRFVARSVAGQPAGFRLGVAGADRTDGGPPVGARRLGLVQSALELSARHCRGSGHGDRFAPSFAEPERLEPRGSGSDQLALSNNVRFV